MLRLAHHHLDDLAPIRGAVFEVREGRRHGYVAGELWNRVTTALWDRGVEFMAATDDHGAGVRFRRP